MKLFHGLPFSFINNINNIYHFQNKTNIFQFDIVFPKLLEFSLFFNQFVGSTSNYSITPSHILWQNWLICLVWMLGLNKLFRWTKSVLTNHSYFLTTLTTCFTTVLWGAQRTGRRWSTTATGFRTRAGPSQTLMTHTPWLTRWGQSFYICLLIWRPQSFLEAVEFYHHIEIETHILFYECKILLGLLYIILGLLNQRHKFR